MKVKRMSRKRKKAFKKWEARWVEANEAISKAYPDFMISLQLVNPHGFDCDCISCAPP